MVTIDCQATTDVTACRRGELPSVHPLRAGITSIHGAARAHTGGPIVATIDFTVIVAP
jgi:hypothetical protein